RGRGVERRNRVLRPVPVADGQGGGDRIRVLGQRREILCRPGRAAQCPVSQGPVRGRPERGRLPGGRKHLLLLLEPVRLAHRPGPVQIAMDACKVAGAGPRATLSCGEPVIVGNSTQCEKVKISPTRTARFCSFLDKDFITIDPARGRLYVSYTDFLLRRPFPSQVELAACDLGNASGGRGPAGGTPAAPV